MRLAPVISIIELEVHQGCIFFRYNVTLCSSRYITALSSGKNLRSKYHNEELRIRLAEIRYRFEIYLGDNYRVQFII